MIGLFDEDRRDGEAILVWLRRLRTLGNPKACAMVHGMHFPAFIEFERKNPHVRELFDQFAMQGIMQGRMNFGARMVWERIRWFTAIETTDLEFKVNNNFIAYYSRLFMIEHPEHGDFFRTRRID